MIFSGLRQDRLAAATHDDLYVRSLTVLNENNTIALVSLERIGFFRPEFMEKFDGFYLSVSLQYFQKSIIKTTLQITYRRTCWSQFPIV